MLDISESPLKALLRVDREDWRENLRTQAEFFEKFGDHLPARIREEHEAPGKRLRAK
ncbi:MAG: phosphoenolpyruvate carboxykinase (GTP) [Deltaproteobacteria bacterium]|nr:phosphoenolpyruvate carboxykinase (GTP) [Deltaproteobacteria bacterium]